MRYVIVVSEPWGFSNGVSENKIYGRIVKRINEKFVIFEAETPIELKGHKGAYLFLSPRQNSDSIDIEENGHVSVNGLILHSEYDESMTLQEIEGNSTFVIIGRLQRI